MIRSNLNSDKYIQAGLDIGSDKICCAISEIDLKSDTVKLLGSGNSQATSINRGAITHRDNLIDEIEHAIDEARTMSGVSIENLSLGISGEHIRGINTQGAIAIGGSQASNVSLQNEITKNDVKKVLDLAKAISLPMDRDILHVLPQEYVIDTMNSIKDPVGLTGRRLEAKVHVITVATTAATNLVSCVEELGIRVESIIYQGLASSLSTLNDDERKLGVVSVDIGEQPIAHGRHLGLEGAKQPVPHNEHVAVVTIDVLGVRAMVRAMVGRRYQQPLQRPPQLPHHLGMSPETVNCRDRACTGYQQWMKTQQR